MDNIVHYLKRGLVEVKIKPNQNGNSIEFKDGLFTISVKSAPIEGAANVELVKYLKRSYGVDIQIVRGLKSKSKVLKLVE